MQGQGPDALKRAQQCLARTGDLIGNVRNAAARKAFDPVPVALDGVVANVLNLFPIASSMVPTIDLPDSAAWVLADEVQLGQILSNLIRDALEAREGQRVRRLRFASSTAGNGLIEVRIEDNGPGIDPAIRGKLFSNFFRTRESGLGVGLSICKTIVEDHGGRICVEAVPDGTAFRITLPSAGEHDRPDTDAAS